MSLIAKKSEGSPPIEPGTYHAICYSVIDVGTQYSEYYRKSSPKVILTWEIPKLRIEYEKDGNALEGPRVISKTYTNILHEKSNLSQDLISWRGKPFTAGEAKGFDVSKVLGVNCILTVVNEEGKNNKVYANVAGVSGLMIGMKSTEPENEKVFYDIGSGKEAIPETIPSWIKDIILKCEEFTGKSKEYDGSEPTPSNEEDDDIPF